MANLIVRLKIDSYTAPICEFPSYAYLRSCISIRVTGVLASTCHLFPPLNLPTMKKWPKWFKKRGTLWRWPHHGINTLGSVGTFSFGIIWRWCTVKRPPRLTTQSQPLMRRECFLERNAIFRTVRGVFMEGLHFELWNKLQMCFTRAHGKGLGEIAFLPYCLIALLPISK